MYTLNYINTHYFYNTIMYKYVMLVVNYILKNYRIEKDTWY